MANPASNPWLCDLGITYVRKSRMLILTLGDQTLQKLGDNWHRFLCNLPTALKVIFCEIVLIQRITIEMSREM